MGFLGRREGSVLSLFGGIGGFGEIPLWDSQISREFGNRQNLSVGSFLINSPPVPHSPKNIDNSGHGIPKNIDNSGLGFTQNVAQE